MCACIIVVVYMDKDIVHETLLAETQALYDTLDEIRKKGQDTTLEKESREIPDLSGRAMQCRKTLLGHLSKVHCMSWGQDSRTLVTCSQDGKLLVWDCYTGYKLYSIPSTSNWMMGCDLSPSGKLIATGGLDCLCTLYIVSDNPQQPIVLEAHNDYVASCRFLGDDNRLVTASGDCKILLWDTEIEMVTNELCGHTDAILSLATAPDKKILVTGGYDGVAKVWDVRIKDCTHTFQAHGCEIHDVAFFPSGMAFATASEDNTCGLFDLRADQKLVTYVDDTVSCPVYGIDFSKGGRLLFAACDDGTTRLWDTLKGTCVGGLYGHTSNISDVIVSPDGRAVATSSYDATIKIWN